MKRITKLACAGVFWFALTSALSGCAVDYNNSNYQLINSYCGENKLEMTTNMEAIKVTDVTIDRIGFVYAFDERGSGYLGKMVENMNFTNYTDFETLQKEFSDNHVYFIDTDSKIPSVSELVAEKEYLYSASLDSNDFKEHNIKGEVSIFYKPIILGAESNNVKHYVTGKREQCDLTLKNHLHMPLQHTDQTDGMIEYYYCKDCEKYYSDSDGEIEIPAYPLTVNGGTGGGKYIQGTELTISAVAPEEKIFSEWKVESGDVIIASTSNATTTVTIGTEDSLIHAIFQNVMDVISRIKNLIIKKKPAKISYKLGESFQSEGIVIQAVGIASASNAEYSYIVSEDNYTLDTDAFDSSNPGDYDIVVNYEFDNETDEPQKLQKSFTVTVTDELMDDEEYYVDNIKIKTKPIKDTYYTGDEIDLIGLVVVAKRKGLESGERLDDLILTRNDYNVDYDFSTPGTQKVTIEYYDGGIHFDKTLRANFSVHVYRDYYDADDSDDSTSYENTTTATPWSLTETNTWQYRKDDGSYAENEWICVVENGKTEWYYFDSTKMQSGWFTDPFDGHHYYLDPVSGRMAIGRVLIDGTWYDFNNNAPESSGWYYDIEKRKWMYDPKNQTPLGALLQ